MSIANNDYNHLGVSICCASNGVMNVGELKRFIKRIAAMGYNTLQLIIDDIFKIDTEPYFGYLRGGYSEKEIREVDDFAAENGVELIPSIQTLGHMYNLLRLPHYAGIADTSDILLVDEEKTYILIDKMFATLRKLFRSSFVNIGMDEAHRVGLGNYYEKHGWSDRYDLMLRHLSRVTALAKKHDIHPIMWSDMFFKLANHGKYSDKQVRLSQEVKDRIPEDIALCYWEYLSDEAEIYDNMFEAHIETGQEFWFAGAACTSNGFAPFNAASIKALKTAFPEVEKYQVKNVLITIWGDDGHDCSYNSVLPALYAASMYARGIYDEEIIASGFFKMFGVNFTDFLMLDLPNKSELNSDMTKMSNPCKSLLFNDCFLGWKDKKIIEQAHIPYDEYANTLQTIAKKAGEFSYLFENLANLCETLHYKAELGVKTRAAYQKGNKAELKNLVGEYYKAAGALLKFKDSLRAVWMRENKPYGWEIHEIRLGGLHSRILDCAHRLEKFLSGSVDSIPELTETILEYADWGLQYNLYRGLVTLSLW